MNFRNLKENEIEVRIQSIKEKGAVLLLYKDARCDMNILDEEVGCLNWQRRHSRENANCEVGIYNEKLEEWIWKEDTGTESNTEQAKGLASDSFKRACFNWGIGRELYTAPFLWVSAEKLNLVNGKCYEKFSIEKIVYVEGKKEIEHISIINSKGERVFVK